MYTNGLLASPEEIMDDGRRMVSFADELMKELNSFQANKDSLMGIWHGSSATSFSDVYEEEKQALSAFQQLLDAKGHSLQEASGILSDAEATNASNASKLGN